MRLVIVESPTKARTIGRFLEKEYQVLSSFGHVRDLPQDRLGVDVKADFTPEYIISPKATKNVRILQRESKKAQEIILATDEDREGEAIAYHLKELLAPKNKKLIFKRITFHEITPPAIKKALIEPREIDLNLFDAQQARRILDRLVGYQLSPFLWKKVRKGLSAGRVQSVAVRLIVERERERENFKAEEYWKIRVVWNKKKKEEDKKTFLTKVEIIKNQKAGDVANLNRETAEIGYVALLNKIKGKKIARLDLKKEEEIKIITADLAQVEMKVSHIEQKKTLRSPAPPFRTSTLQQEAGRRFGFPAKRTMRVAQQLYEGIKVDGKRVGLITYMRTDSLNISSLAVSSIQKYVSQNLGQKYLPDKPRFFRQKAKGAQEAHEAIRPTYVEKDPEKIKQALTGEQYRLYRLIWERTVASQMANAEINNTIVNFTAGFYELQSRGSQIAFDGFFRIFGKEVLKEELLPELVQQETVKKEKILGEQKFTEPPGRYTEATLIKTLEENGIGRPSTYAPTISTVQERSYVSKDERGGLFPEEIGCVVNDILVEHFPNIVEIPFTAKMEKDLDEIAQGKKKWIPVIREFYDPFKENLDRKTKEVAKFQKILDRNCPECGKVMVEKFGKFGNFYACSGYPECKYTEANEEEKKLQAEAGQEKCPECGSPLVLRQSRFGRFMGCSNYPKCKFIKKFEKKLGIKCPECGKGELVEKRSRRGPFYACNQYPKCKYIAKGKPVMDKKCPKCGQVLFHTKDGDHCLNVECGI